MEWNKNEITLTNVNKTKKIYTEIEYLSKVLLHNKHLFFVYHINKLLQFYLTTIVVQADKNRLTLKIVIKDRLKNSIIHVANEK